MKLMSLKQFEKKSRSSLMRFIIGYLKTQSKKQVAIFAYTLAKSKLPRLSIRERRKGAKTLAYYRSGKLGAGGKLMPMRKTKRIFIKKDDRYVMKKFSRKQLAAQRLFAKRARAGTLRKRRR